jgi:hypothetical protein
LSGLDRLLKGLPLTWNVERALFYDCPFLLFLPFGQERLFGGEMASGIHLDD